MIFCRERVVKKPIEAREAEYRRGNATVMPRNALPNVGADVYWPAPTFEEILPKIRENGWVHQVYCDVSPDQFSVGIIRTSCAGAGGKTEVVEESDKSGATAALRLWKRVQDWHDCYKDAKSREFKRESEE